MIFHHLKNIDSAITHLKMFSLFLVAACTIICLYTVYTSYRLIARQQERIYILANGKALEAMASERKDNIAVEARDHVKMFHLYFFSLDPDEKVIQRNTTKALYLSDGSAKRQYDNLKEGRYYSNIISANISQQIDVDSVQINLHRYPFYFKCFSTQRLIRTTAIVTRSLVTEGYLRNVARSDNNPHGFLIENWVTLENRDLKIEHRQHEK